jgi:RNA polymerase sigma factor (sigma-70 family)
MNAPDPNSTAAVQRLLDLIRNGDRTAVEALLNATTQRLTVLARKILGNIPHVRRFEQTDDLLQNSLVRIWKAFDQHAPPTPLDYYRLASNLMRRELIDLSRHYFGPEGAGANLAVKQQANSDQSAMESPIDLESDETSEPVKLGRWTEFHEYVHALPDEDRTLFDLLWYQGLTLDEAAVLMDSSERTIRRRWKAARMTVYEKLMEP